MVTNLKFRLFFIFVNKVNLCARIHIKKLHCNRAMIHIIAFINMPYNLSIYAFFYTAAICLLIVFFKVLINLSETTDFPSLCVEYISCKHDFIDLL